MSLNPFEEKPVSIESTIQDWGSLYPKQYNKNEVDPYTKTRIILMNGTEFEANWFSHQFSRHCDNNDLRRELALTRRIEQQQQKKISNLRPLDETILETTISYEQLAVDLTCALAKVEKDKDVKNALDFALLEDFDHLYRYSNLLEMEQGSKAENLVGHYTEIMPARPTISHHRHPYDSMRRSTDSKKADLLTNLNIGIITAAEQQTMNYYMNVSSLYKTDIGRKLYLEIGMVEEQHVSQYGSLKDTRCTWLEELLMHEYTECYLYYSCYEDEKDENIKKIWEECFIQEVAHLHKAAELLQKYENKQWQQVIPNGEFPKLLNLGPNKEYIRDILTRTVNLTAKREDYAEVSSLPQDYDFFKYQDIVNKNITNVASHVVIGDHIRQYGTDYRFEESVNPIEELRDRHCDNITVGRVK
ncbi:hypothetical protein FDF74_09860 [Clostridium niameyense]|uniref:Ferritin-like domain-containing protein n=1 Tax=Clostridium niameyense TaxID=1622073 RepID=A0A6M0RB89_9CLOT|nr:hypothetical protein [Clostridium niameyense]NEZ47496.1 hypothetical protein [Clostridium niameyense]